MPGGICLGQSHLVCGFTFQSRFSPTPISDNLQGNSQLASLYLPKGGASNADSWDSSTVTGGG